MKHSPKSGDASTSTSEAQSIDFSKLNVARLAHNYLPDSTVDGINILGGFLGEVLNPEKRNLPTYKVGLMFICINEPYWPYIQPVVDDARRLFLPGHDVEIMLWSDLQNYEATKNVDYGCTVFPVDSVGWPYPTLMRYHMLLQQEEYLKKFDYIFYLDTDMRIVNVVGDEIFGDLMAAQHPMYALRQNFNHPYEPNPESAAYFKQPGWHITKNGLPMFEPIYAAGGFQGGKTALFIEAMKAMRDGIDKDLNKNYIARWNDESHWNKYLLDNPPSVVLSPSYVYPDSMIDEYYVKLWGRNYTPRIITLTKPFSTSKEGGAAAQEMMKTL